MTNDEIRQLDDEDLEATLDWSVNLATRTAVRFEIARRAEIKLNRGMDAQYGPNPFGFTVGDVSAKHDASWYESRQTEEQWLSEVEGQPESGTYRLI
jgi:hypothetical protein